MSSKKTNTPEVVEMKRADLVAAAKDLNDVLQPEPKIKVVGSTDVLKKDIIAAGKLLDKNDEIQQITAAVLKSLGCKFMASVVAPESDETTDETDKTTDDADVDDDDTTEGEWDALVAAAEELSAIEGIDDTIDVSKCDTVEELKAAIKSYCSLLAPGDKFGKKTAELLKSMGILDAKGKLAKAGGKKGGKAGGGKKEKTSSGPSAYGTAVDIMCKNPDIEKDELVKQVKAAGVNADAGKSAVNTAYSAVRSIVAKLKANKLMK